jgi:hypothetical protein
LLCAIQRGAHVSTTLTTQQCDEPDDNAHHTKWPLREDEARYGVGLAAFSIWKITCGQCLRKVNILLFAYVISQTHLTDLYDI